jgi:hypothetical protein
VVEPRTIVENNPPASSPNRGGGGGGTVFLIAGILFIGYLYTSKRLQGVFAAIKTPTGLPGGGPPFPATSNATPVVPGTTPGYSTVPISPAGYPRQFTLTFPAQYNAQPIQISAADPATCEALVYSGTFLATGSPILAATYAARYCQ